MLLRSFLALEKSPIEAQQSVGQSSKGLPAIGAAENPILLFLEREVVGSPLIDCEQAAFRDYSDYSYYSVLYRP